MYPNGTLGDPPSPADTATVEPDRATYIDRGLALAILPAFAGLLAQPGVLARFAALADARRWAGTAR